MLRFTCFLFTTLFLVLCLKSGFIHRVSIWIRSGPDLAEEKAVPLRRLVVCSQNLNRLGEVPKRIRSRKNRSQSQTSEEKVRSLVLRIKNAGCDVIAVQEVSGRDLVDAERSIGSLQAVLQERTGREFLAFLGDTEDSSIRSGFLVARGISMHLHFKSYTREPLRRLNRHGPVGRFLRAPVGLELELLAPNARLNVFILNIHFKSRAFGFKDVQGTDFELLRMEMAETARCLVLRKRKERGNQMFAILTGDRNSGKFSASADILSGRRILDDFRSGEPACRLDEHLQTDCQESMPRPLQLVPILEAQGLFSGTYSYRGQSELLDEMLVLPESVSRVYSPGRGFQAGVQGRYHFGSDHRLVWLEINLEPVLREPEHFSSVIGEPVEGSDISEKFCETHHPSQ